MYPIRLAGALEIGDGADQAAEALKPCMEYATRRDEPAAEQRKSDPGSDGTARAADDQDRRKGILCAWLAPLMYHSSLPQTTPTRNGGRQSNAPESAAGNNLDKFLSWLTERSRSSEESRRSLSLEIALAQGFRLAANKRGYDHTPYRYRQAVMIDRAEQALKYSRYWFSQLALIQALTLLSLPTDPAEELASNGHGSDPRRLVEYWVAQAGSQTVAAHGDGGRHPHPFVRAAGELCVLALLTRRPAEYCWIDEPTVIHRVGSHSRDRRSQYNQRSWIMSSVGWSALHPQAQRLLADVQVMLNLTERYEDTADADRRLPRADRHDPPSYHQRSKPAGSRPEFRLCEGVRTGLQLHRQLPIPAVPVPGQRAAPLRRAERELLPVADLATGAVVRPTRRRTVAAPAAIQPEGVLALDGQSRAAKAARPEPPIGGTGRRWRVRRADGRNDAGRWCLLWCVVDTGRHGPDAVVGSAAHPPSDCGRRPTVPACRFRVPTVEREGGVVDVGRGQDPPVGAATGYLDHRLSQAQAHWR